MNRVFLHGNRQTPIATSLAPRDSKSAKAKGPDRKRSRRKEENENWEQDAGNVSVPEITEDKEQPQERAEKYDAIAGNAEQISGPPAKSLEIPEEASDFKEIIDVNLTDRQTSSSSCAK